MLLLLELFPFYLPQPKSHVISHILCLQRRKNRNDLSSFAGNSLDVSNPEHTKNSRKIIGNGVAHKQCARR